MMMMMMMMMNHYLRKEIINDYNNYISVLDSKYTPNFRKLSCL